MLCKTSVFTQKAQAFIAYLQSKSQGEEEQLFTKNEIHHDAAILQVVKVHIYCSMLILDTVHQQPCKNHNISMHKTKWLHRCVKSKEVWDNS